MRRMLLLLAAALVSAAVAAGVALAAGSPTVATQRPTSVTQTSAVLRGTVTPNGVKTFYRFNYGLTASLGAQTPVRTLKAGTRPVNVAAAIGNLLPGTTYYFQVVALNQNGGSASSLRKFRTAGHPLPQPQTGQATVTSSYVTVSGVVSPQGEATTYYFQYGPNGAPANSDVQTPVQTLPAGNAPVSVSYNLYGLAPLTSYHFRLVAAHSGFAPQHGAYNYFLTFPSPRPIPRVRARTLPHRIHRRPFVFATAGRVIVPRGIPRYAACTATVRVTFLVRRRVVAQDLAGVASDCTFRTATLIGKLPRHRRNRPLRLRVLVQFSGNGYTAPASARPQRVLVF